MKKVYPKRVQIEAIGFDPITQSEVVERIDAAIAGRKRAASFRVIKPYVEFFEGARQDAVIAEAVNSANLVVADSVAVQWAGAWLAEPLPTLGKWLWSLAVGLRREQWLKRIIPERGAGVSASHQLLVTASQRGWRVGIIGGPKDTTATEAALRERYPVLQLQGVWSGYFTGVESAVEKKRCQSIRAAQLDILFVAMGFPLQEAFMYRHRQDNLARVLIGEGGTFDYDAMGGPRRRAPEWMQRAGLEWAWRLLLEPRRIFRQLAIPRFMMRMYRLARVNQQTYRQDHT